MEDLSSIFEPTPSYETLPIHTFYEGYPSPKKIGQGSYGTVYSLTGDILEKKSLTFNNIEEIEYSNIIETCFLASFDVPIIPLLYDIKVELDEDEDETYIVLLEKYAGQTLTKFAEGLSYKKRIEFIPILLVQMGRILVWMQDHCIAHVDIKPSNMTVNKDGTLTLIDWGFVSNVFLGSKKYHGTVSYADPKFLDYSKHPTYAYDMFGMGWSLIDFLLKSPILSGNIITRAEYEKIRNKDDIKNLFTDISNTIGTEYVDIIKKMTEYNEKDRITSIELYYHPLLISLRGEYPLIESENNTRIERVDFRKFTDVNQRMYGILIDWLFDVSQSQEVYCPNAILLTISILNKFLNLHPEISRKNLQAIGICCYHIATILQGKEYTFDDMEDITNNTYTRDFLYELFMDILDELKWNVYPHDCLADYGIDLSNKTNAEKYKNILVEISFGKPEANTYFIYASFDDQVKILKREGLISERFEYNFRK